LQHIRAFLSATRIDGKVDDDLLERFVKHSDEAAFETILKRHGPMVMSVCRRILPEVHDAEDAFQATFLVLICKAHSIAKRNSVGSWLYGSHGGGVFA